MTKRAAAARSIFRSDKRKSDELAVNALLIGGFEIGGTSEYDGYFRFEAEAGRRQIVAARSARPMRIRGWRHLHLDPEDRESGWVGRLRGIGGNANFRLAGEVGAEEREGKVGLSARASLVLGL
jgi:hypothetical protein